jgi:hypothetical protein
MPGQVARAREHLYLRAVEQLWSLDEVSFMDLEGRARELAVRLRQEQEARDIEQQTKAEDRRRAIEAARQLSRDFQALAQKYNIPSHPLYKESFSAESSFLCRVWIVRPYERGSDDSIPGIAVDENGNAYYFTPFTDYQRKSKREQPRKNAYRKKNIRDTVLINAPDNTLLVEGSGSLSWDGSDSPLDNYLDNYTDFQRWQTYIDEAAARIVGA